jgi:hypothetical protein
MFQSCDLLFHHVLNIFLNPKLYWQLLNLIDDGFLI